VVRRSKVGDEAGGDLQRGEDAGDAPPDVHAVAPVGEADGGQRPGNLPLDGGGCVESAADGALSETARAAASVEPDGEGVADGIERHLDPRSVELSQAQGLIVAAVISVVLLPGPIGAIAASGLLSVSSIAPTAGWLLVTTLMALAALRWPAIAHRHASYTISALGIEIRRGVVWRTVVNVPRSRVQHTDVSQGPIERRYGLGRLIIYTAGSSQAQVTLHGLDHQVALRIRDCLLPREVTDAL
jgi:uncharacterized protein